MNPSSNVNRAGDDHEASAPAMEDVERLVRESGESRDDLERGEEKDVSSREEPSKRFISQRTHVVLPSCQKEDNKGQTLLRGVRNQKRSSPRPIMRGRFA